MENKVRKSWAIIVTVDNIWSVIQHLGLPKLIVSLAGGLGMGILSFVEKAPLYIAILIALAIILIVIWVWNGITWRRERRPPKEAIIEGGTNSFALPHVFRLDASQLRQGKNYVSLNYLLVSKLSYDLKLMIGKALLVIDNESTEEWMLYPVTVKKQPSDSEPWYKEVILGEKVSTSVREKLQKKVAVRIRLLITYWDYEGGEYHFNTDAYGLEMIAL